MTMPEFGPRDLFFVSAGPGDLTTARALVGVAHKAGARSPPTASPPGSSTRCRSTQTIANDQGRQALGPADGLAVRDRAGDRFRNRNSQAPPALRVAWRNRASADPRARGRRRRCAWPFGADGARGAIAAGFAVKIWQSTVASDGRFCTGFWTPAATKLSARSVSRRPKSVEARSRGEFGAGWAAALWGFDFRADYDGGREAGARRPG